MFPSNPRNKESWSDGESTTMSLGLRGSNGFWLRVGYTQAKSYLYLNDLLGFYWDVPTQDQFQLITLEITRRVIQGKGYDLSLGLGLAHRRIRVQSVSYSFDVVGSQINISSIPEFSSYSISDLGLALSIENGYMVNQTLYLGLNISTYLIFYGGLEGVNISPTVRVYF